MSDRLVVEFYRGAAENPVGAVLAFHGGDNPATGALNVAAFVLEMRQQNTTSEIDVEDLIGRYISWQSKEGTPGEVIRIDPEKTQPYQVIRVRTNESGISLTVVADLFSSEDELLEATKILTQARLPFHIETFSASSSI